VAVKATFIADFASFQKAVNDARKGLDLFESDVRKVERQMKTLDDSFSGRQIIQQAAQTAAAIEKIGGASMLTVAEQQRVNSIVTEAIAKYAALGQTAPKALLDIEQATRKVVAATEPAARTTSIFGQSIDSLSSKGTLGSQAMSALTGTFGKFTAAGVAVNVISSVTNKLGEFVERGTKLGPIEDSFERLTATVNQSSTDMLQSMGTATRGLVADFDLMQSANKAILLGLPVTSQEMGDLAKTATVLGKAMGLDATQSLNDLITALGRSSPLILDNLGLTVKVGEANEAYAAKLGKSVEAMTEAEKKMAFYVAAMDAARIKTQQLGDITLTLGEHITRAWTSVGNVVTGAVSAINKGIGAAISGIENTASNVGGFFSNIYNNGLRATIQTGLFNTSLAAVARSAEQVAKTPPFSPNYVAQVDAIRLKVESLTQAQRDQIKAAETLGGDALAKLLKHYDLTETHLKVLNQTTKAAVTGTKDFASEAAQMVRVIKLQEESARKTSMEFGKLSVSLRKWGEELAGDNLAIAERQFKALEEAARKAGTAIQILPSLTTTLMAGGEGSWFDTIAVNTNIGGHAKKVVSPFRDAFTEFGKELPDIIFGTLQGGGSMVGAVASGLAAVFSKQFQTALAKSIKDGTSLSTGNRALGVAGVGLGSFVGGFEIGNSTTSKTKGALGGAASGAMAGLPLAGVTGGLSVAVGAIAGAIGGLIGSSKKAKEELLKLRQAQEDITKHFGGVEKLQAAAEGAGISIGNALKTKNAAEFQRFVDRLNVALEKQQQRWEAIAPTVGEIQRLGGRLPASFQGYIDQLEKGKKLSVDNLSVLKQLTGEGEVDWQRLQGVAEQYGISLAGLGDKFQTAKLSAGAQQIWDDFQLLIGAGADTNTVLDGMADEIANLVKNAKTFGVAIPENFRPLIEQLMTSGKLLDENGEAITDLSNLKFSDSIQTSIEKLVDTLQEFLDTLLEIPSAMDRIPRRLDMAIAPVEGGGGDRPESAFGGPIVIETNIDGAMVARNQVQHVPFALRTAGVI
jgi:hypothetical protein